MRERTPGKGDVERIKSAIEIEAESSKVVVTDKRRVDKEGELTPAGGEEVPKEKAVKPSEVAAEDDVEEEDEDSATTELKKRIQNIKDRPWMGGDAKELSKGDERKVELLDTKGFASFLAQGPDMDLEGMTVREVESHFKAFESASEISKELRNLYKNEISRDTGIVLSEEEMGSVDDFIASLSFEDPKRLASLKEQLELYVELPKRIGKKEKELAELCGMETLETVRKTQGWNRKDIPALGWFFRSGEENKARKTVREEMGLKLGNVKDAMEFMNLREELFQNLGPAKELAQIAGKRARERFEAMFNAEGNLEEMEKAQAYFDKLGGSGEFGMQYMEEEDREVDQEELDEAIDMRIVRDIDAALDAMTPRSSKPLTALESVLKKFVDKEAVGSKKRDTAKNFVRNIIRDRMGRESDKAKKILLQGWFIKNR